MWCVYFTSCYVDPETSTTSCSDNTNVCAANVTTYSIMSLGGRSYQHNGPFRTQKNSSCCQSTELLLTVLL